MSEFSVKDTEDKELYPINVKSGLIKNVGVNISMLFSNVKVLIISDVNVMDIYGNTLAEDLRNNGFEVHKFTLPAGDESRTFLFLNSALECLNENKFSMSDIVVSLGGRNVAGIAGFTASMYQGGMKFVLIPTTLVSVFDSPFETFYRVYLKSASSYVQTSVMPDAVYIDPDTVLTCSDDVNKSGIAEVIKYAFLYDKQLFELLNGSEITDDNKKTGYRDNIKKITEIMISLKCSMIKERENILQNNEMYSAICKMSANSLADYEIFTISLLAEAKLGMKYGECTQQIYDELISVLGKYDLPVKIPYTKDDFNEYFSELSLKKEVFALPVPANNVGESQIIKFKTKEHEEWFD